MTPIERAAKALKEESERLFQEGVSPELRDFMVGRKDAGWEFLVRAVLTSIREPSEAMLSEKTLFAGFFHDADGVEDNLYHDRDDALQIWQAMIDAALSEDA